MTALLVAYGILLFVRPARHQSLAIDGWGVDLFELVASALCVIGGLRRRPGSAVPIILGAALACWSLGDLVLTIESVGGVTPDAPTWADALYLSFFPLSYVAVVLLIRGEKRQLSSPNWLDGAVAGLGAGAVCAAFAFAAITHTTRESDLGIAVNLAYPLGDVLLLLLVVGGTAVVAGRRKAPWCLLAVGFSVNVLGDSSNLLHASLGGSQVGYVVNGVAWPISILLMSMAMWLRPGWVDPLAARRPPGFLLPGLAAAAGLVVLFVRTLSPVNRVATGLAAGTLLLVVFRTWLSVRQLQTQSKIRHRQSVTDHLTGLANRRWLFDALDAYFAQAAADRPELAFLFIDLNGFKQINDSFGHPVGDELLKRVSARLQQALKPSDLLARAGGDEFAAMLVGAGASEAATAAARVSASLDEPFQFDAVTATIGASIGIALAPADAGDADGLMSCADAAMYRAKLGSTRFARFEAARYRGADKLRLADELSTAIDRGELIPHYQPQLDLRDGGINGVEALVRWHHPNHGLIEPLTFLPLAEEAGMMGKLTHWVLSQALTQCRAWRTARTPVRVSVNMSASDLVNPDFPGTVAALLSRELLSPESLMLEITETSIIADFQRAKLAVVRLRELGVQVSIDDFGAGFTSLAYLNELAVGQLKLDRRFIAPLAGGPRSGDAHVVRATIELGHALGLEVVAEGVSDDRALELLRELGCDVAQGYRLGRPVPAAELRLRPRSAPAPAPARPAHVLRPSSRRLPYAALGETEAVQLLRHDGRR